MGPRRRDDWGATGGAGRRGRETTRGRERGGDSSTRKIVEGHGVSRSSVTHDVGRFVGKAKGGRKGERVKKVSKGGLGSPV